MPIPVALLELGKQRIRNILRDRLYANARQLESKISEAGPTNKRCNPHVLTAALKDLTLSHEVSTENHPVDSCQFYYLTENARTKKNQKTLQARSNKINAIYSTYRSIAQDRRLVGDALETVFRTALKSIPDYFELGSKKNPLTIFGDKTLPGALDGTYLLGKKKLFLAVEAKNIREWIYPDRHELWSLINKANTISDDSNLVLPVLISRKIPYYARRAFKSLGVLGYEMHNQIFDPSVSNQLELIKHKDGLGFHDISTDLSPPEKLVSFLQETVFEYGENYAATFLENKDLFDTYAAEMADERIKGAYRKSRWSSVKTELGIYDNLDFYE